MSCRYKNKCPSYSGWCEGPKQDLTRCVPFLVTAYENEKNKHKWIPVTEKLPEKPEYDWVLVQVKMNPEGRYGVPHIAELRNGIWYTMGYPYDVPLEEQCGAIVTDWMPIPGDERGK